VIVLPTVSKLAILELLADTGNLLDAVKVGLYSANVTLTVDTVLADLTPADFSGYAISGVVVWGTPFIDGTGRVLMTGDEKEFVATSPFTVSNTVYGYYITESTPTTLLYAEAFTTPRIISAASQGLTVLPTFDCLSASA